MASFTEEFRKNFINEQLKRWEKPDFKWKELPYFKFRKLIYANMIDGKSGEESIFDAGKTWINNGNSLDDIVDYQVKVNTPRSNLDTWLALRECNPQALEVQKNCLSMKSKDMCSLSFHSLKECMNQVTNPKEKQDLENCIDKGLLDVLKIMTKVSKEEFSEKGVDHWNALLRQHQNCSEEREELRVKSIELWNRVIPPPAKQKYDLLRGALQHCRDYAAKAHACAATREDCLPEAQQLVACSTTYLKISSGAELSKCLANGKSQCKDEYNKARLAIDEYKYGFIKDLGFPDTLNSHQKK